MKDEWYIDNFEMIAEAEENLRKSKDDNDDATE